MDNRVPEGDSQATLRRIARRPVYVAAALLMALIAALGFLPNMLRAAFNGTIPHDWIIHGHVAVYWTWLALFFAQTVNAALGRIQTHKRLGKVLITYGVAMFLVGVGVTLNRTINQIRAGKLDLARQVNLAPVVDMLVFPVLFALAVHYRYKPELHKRLMILTATQLLYPAVARMEFLPKHNWAIFAVWSAPVVLGIAHDWITRRLIHPVYVGGMVLFVVLTMRTGWIGSKPWVAAISWLVSWTHGAV